MLLPRRITSGPDLNYRHDQRGSGSDHGGMARRLIEAIASVDDPRQKILVGDTITD